MIPDDPYRDPVLYDLEYAQQQDDVTWYVAFARRQGGPVLELGCGNGRISLPIARAGMAVHGIDLSETMLDDFERRLPFEPERVRARVRFKSGDFRNLEVQRKYPAVLLPFNALHHCTDAAEMRKTLHGVRAALRPDGRFALDCYLPDPILYARDPNRRYEERSFTDPRTGCAIHSWERGWWDAATSTHHVLYEYEHADGRTDRVHLALHMIEQDALRALVAECGFAFVHEARDFAGTPLGERPLKWVMELRPT